MKKNVIIIISLIFFLISCENKKKENIYDTGNSGNTGSSADSGNTGNSGLPDNNTPDNNNSVDDFNENDNDIGDTVDSDIIQPDKEDSDDDQETNYCEDDVKEKPDESQRVMTATIISPVYSAVFEGGKPFNIKGEVSDSEYSADQLSVKWEIKKGNLWSVLLETNSESTGISEFQHTISENDAAYFYLRLTVKAPDNFEVTSKEVVFGICTYPFGKIQDFDDVVLGEGWIIAGDAYRDSESLNGWIELTGNDYNKKGLIYNNILKVYPGDITIKLDIRTGQPDIPGDSGADGFAMTVFDADNVVALSDYVAAVKTGGCLGYGVAGGYCGSTGEMNVSAFHIEFDTWNNIEQGLDDPTTENHIAINLNGDPGGHKLWKNIFLEDSLWHSIEVVTSESNVTVKMDNNIVIDNEIEGFSFRGGYFIFSGSTGSYKNLHSIDNLEVVQQCMVP